MVEQRTQVPAAAIVAAVQLPLPRRLRLRVTIMMIMMQSPRLRYKVCVRVQHLAPRLLWLGRARGVGRWRATAAASAALYELLPIVAAARRAMAVRPRISMAPAIAALGAP